MTCSLMMVVIFRFNSFKGLEKCIEIHGNKAIKHMYFNTFLSLFLTESRLGNW